MFENLKEQYPELNLDGAQFTTLNPKENSEMEIDIGEHGQKIVIRLDDFEKEDEKITEAAKKANPFTDFLKEKFNETDDETK